MKTNIVNLHLIYAVIILQVLFVKQAIAQNCVSSFSLLEIGSIEVYDLASDIDGNVIAAGCFMGANQDFDPGLTSNVISSSNTKNGFIANYTNDFTLNWVKAIGGDGNVIIYDVTIDDDGNLYTCGHCFGNSIDLDPGTSSTSFSVPENTSGMFVASYTSTGNYRWGITIPAEYSWQLNSTVSAYKIDVDNKGNVLVCGNFQTTNVDFDPGPGTHAYATSTTGGVYNYDAFLVKYSNNGSYIWSAVIQSENWDVAQAVKTDNNGNVYWCGNFSDVNTILLTDNDSHQMSSSGNTDVFISKLNPEGKVIWAKTIGGVMDDQANQIQIDADTNIYLTGIYQETVDMDPGAGIATITSMGNYDCFIAKYDNNGEYIFAKSIGSEEYDNIYETTIDPEQKTISVTGFYKARANNDFDPDDNIVTLLTEINSGNNSMFVASYDLLNGKFKWGTQGICAGGISGISILALQEGTVAVAGRFYGSYENAPSLGNNSSQLAPLGKSGIFLAKLSVATGIPLIDNRKKFNIYPNPVTSRLSFQTSNFNLTNADFELKLYNISGKLLLKTVGNIYELETAVNHIIPQISKGSYQILINNKTQHYKAEFIKQ